MALLNRLKPEIDNLNLLLEGSLLITIKIEISFPPYQSNIELGITMYKRDDTEQYEPFMWLDMQADGKVSRRSMADHPLKSVHEKNLATGIIREALRTLKKHSPEIEKDISQAKNISEFKIGSPA